MIAADTSRSSFYIQSLIRYSLIPNHVFFLKNDSEKSLPGQLDKNNFQSEMEHRKTDIWSEIINNPNIRTKELLEKNNINFTCLTTTNIHDNYFLNLLKERREKTFIFSGYGGVILKDKIFATNKNFLHVHGGYLPDYKGSTTNYYSIINEDSLGASSIFLTNEIDGGPILKKLKFPTNINKKRIDHIYDNAARAKILVNTLKDYKEKGKFIFSSKNTKGQTYYIIHPLLKHISILS